MGVEKYQADGRTLWKVDAWLDRPDGPPIRLRQTKIPTREQAVALETKLKTEAFEGQFLQRNQMATAHVAELWALRPAAPARPCRLRHRRWPGPAPAPTPRELSGAAAHAPGGGRIPWGTASGERGGVQLRPRRRSTAKSSS